MATRKVRVKKLNTKQPLDVLIESEIDANEYQSLTQELSIATGVDQAEENVRTKSRAYHVTPLSPYHHIVYHNASIHTPPVRLTHMYACILT